jgi:hypothetical protein
MDCDGYVCSGFAALHRAAFLFMGIESDMLCDGLMEREDSDFGATFTYGALKGLPCSLGTIGYGGRLVAGGISPNAEATIVIRKSVLPGDNLKVGNSIVVTKGDGKAKNLKIAKEGIRDCIFAWELTLDDQNQNA